MEGAADGVCGAVSATRVARVAKSLSCLSVAKQHSITFRVGTCCRRAQAAFRPSNCMLPGALPCRRARDDRNRMAVAKPDTGYERVGDGSASHLTDCLSDWNVAARLLGGAPDGIFVDLESPSWAVRYGDAAITRGAHPVVGHEPSASLADGGGPFHDGRQGSAGTQVECRGERDPCRDRVVWPHWDVKRGQCRRNRLSFRDAGAAKVGLRIGQRPGCRPRCELVAVAKGLAVGKRSREAVAQPRRSLEIFRGRRPPQGTMRPVCRARR